MKKELQLSISKGNSKMGLIPSVSLPPIITCNPNVPCFKKCYAAKLCRIYPTVKKAYNNNLELYKTDPLSYCSQLNNAIANCKYFRLHVSGDFVNSEYFNMVVKSARAYPSTTILAFTKQYNIVNDYIRVNGSLPNNFKVIFSGWDGLTVPNPYNLPMAQVIFKGHQPNDNWKICGGNCSECACRGVGCWELKKGETIAFYEH